MRNLSPHVKNLNNLCGKALKMDTEKHTELPCLSPKLFKRLKQKDHRLKA